MKKEDFLKIIKFLDEKGVFLIKNSIEWVAKKLNISKFTIYAYLKEVRIDQEIHFKMNHLHARLCHS
jgi:predicted transcriptional regulator YheO